MNTFLCFIAAVVTLLTCIGFYGVYMALTNEKYNVPKGPFLFAFGLLVLGLWGLFVLVTTV